MPGVLVDSCLDGVQQEWLLINCHLLEKINNSFFLFNNKINDDNSDNKDETLVTRATKAVRSACPWFRSLINEWLLSPPLTSTTRTCVTSGWSAPYFSTRRIRALNDPCLLQFWLVIKSLQPLLMFSCFRIIEEWILISKRFVFAGPYKQKEYWLPRLRFLTWKPENAKSFENCVLRAAAPPPGQ